MVSSQPSQLWTATPLSPRLLDSTGTRQVDPQALGQESKSEKRSGNPKNERVSETLGGKHRDIHSSVNRALESASDLFTYIPGERSAHPP